MGVDRSKGRWREGFLLAHHPRLLSEAEAARAEYLRRGGISHQTMKARLSRRRKWLGRKASLACVLVVSWACHAVADPCLDGQVRAKKDVRDSYSSGKAFRIGLLSGAVAWIPGIFVGMTIGGKSENPDALQVGEVSKGAAPDSVECYKTAYRRETRDKNKSAAFVGGMFGMSVSFIIVGVLAGGFGLAGGH